ANKNSVVVLLNGSPIEMTSWIGDCNAVLEAWYPGEQGSQAICEILFGEYSPNAKLPITIPKSVGQVPLFYAYKPSGRGYGYNENDGKPLYPFGYGLSYTDFEIKNIAHNINADNSVTVKLDISNIGEYDGAEVIQIYLSGKNYEVVRPIKELKAYKKVNVKKGVTENTEIVIPEEAFFYYGIDLAFDIHDGDYSVLVGTSSENIIGSFELKVRDKKVING
ncbi:MAG: glycoside hydrolase family 3 C-terminal domain-containing protein, partial [Clostridia bacterium]|nr:glycoside hydrolase family 3 C-terminal domain-containing protein [Clostridia bacterium]